MGIIIGIVLILAVAAFFAVMTCKSKHSDLFRWLLIAIFVAICITWVVPYGYFNGATYGEVAMKELVLQIFHHFYITLLILDLQLLFTYLFLAVSMEFYLKLNHIVL